MIKMIDNCFFEHIIKSIFLSNMFITNRHPCLLGLFWKIIYACLHIHYLKTTAYHTQVDRAIKYLYQTLESAIWLYIVSALNNWYMFLSLFKLEYNTNRYCTTGFVSFELLYTQPQNSIQQIFHPHINIINSAENEIIKDYIQIAHNCILNTVSPITKSMQLQKIFYNRHDQPVQQITLRNYFALRLNMHLIVPINKQYS